MPDLPLELQLPDARNTLFEKPETLLTMDNRPLTMTDVICSLLGICTLLDEPNKYASPPCFVKFENLQGKNSEKKINMYWLFTTDKIKTNNTNKAVVCLDN